MKFGAQIIEYKIKQRVDGKVARIVLEVPEKEIPKSYFVGELVKAYVDFSVDNIIQDITE